MFVVVFQTNQQVHSMEITQPSEDPPVEISNHKSSLVADLAGLVLVQFRGSADSVGKSALREGRLKRAL